MSCKRCVDRGQPENYGTIRCAFESGEFSPDNWNCATAGAIRQMMGESDHKSPHSFYAYRDDNSYAAVWIPPHPEDVPNGERVGPWRGGGFIAGHWYKHRGRTDMLIRVDPRDGGTVKESGKLLLLSEAEAAIENWDLGVKAAINEQHRWG